MKSRLRKQVRPAIPCLFLVLALLMPTKTFSECATNSIGTVYCSEFPTGGAALNNIGMVMCGKGQCKADSIGTVWCSTVEGGGAAVNSTGTVKCLGGCERGSRSMCTEGQ